MAIKKIQPWRGGGGEEKKQTPSNKHDEPPHTRQHRELDKAERDDKVIQRADEDKPEPFNLEENHEGGGQGYSIESETTPCPPPERFPPLR